MNKISNYNVAFLQNKVTPVIGKENSQVTYYLGSDNNMKP